MRDAEKAVKINKAVEKILELLKEEHFTEEEIRDVLKGTEVTLGMKPPMPPHRPPMGPEGMPPMPPHRPPMGPEGMPPRGPRKLCEGERVETTV